MSVYVVSDLHGQYDVFTEGIEKSGFNDEDYLYVIGDAIDRGDDGIRILQHIMEHNNMDLLIGNHELLMLNSVDLKGKDKCNGDSSRLWLYGNGGNKTFAQYEKLSLKARKDLLLWLMGRDLIKTLEVNGRSFCLTHSYYIEGQENKAYSEMNYEDIWKIVWVSMYRDDRGTWGPDIYQYYDHTFITGHVPVLLVMRWFERHESFNELRIFEKRNFIDIDGGCALGYQEGLNNGALFLRLNDMKVFTVPMKI